MATFIRDMPRWAVLVLIVVLFAFGTILRAVFGGPTVTIGDDQDSISMTFKLYESIVALIILGIFTVRAFGRRTKGVRLSGPYPRSTRELD